MKKSLIIANVLLAFTNVLGVTFDQNGEVYGRSLRKAIEDSKLTYQQDKDLQKAIEDSMLYEASSYTVDNNDLTNFSQSGAKRIKIEIGMLFNVDTCVNHGDYTSETLAMLLDRDYIFAQLNCGAYLNGRYDQCSLLALHLDKDIVDRLQQLKIITDVKKNVIYVGEYDDPDGITLGEYIEDNNGLASDAAVIWEKIAEKIECRIDIFEFLNQGEDVQGGYHPGGQLYTISSYGTQFKEKVKRLRLDSSPKGKCGHYQELRVFKNGSQVK